MSHPPRRPHLVLYIAPGCCLCDTLKAQLAALREETPFTLEETDITGDPDLEARYRSELPVLLIDGRKAVKYRISTEALRGRLRRAAGLGLLGRLRLR